jgi:hypothetical protein
MSNDNDKLLVELGNVKGQLELITRMLASNHEATNQRIDDLRHATEARALSVEVRVGTLEKNERGTAIKSAAAGAVAGFVSALAIAATKIIR